MDASARIPRPIDLAHTPPFRLGDVEVSPANRALTRGDQREMLEPLVMQVLVALHSAQGEILSRDDLIDACWGGRAVTDDALNRVLSRLRALARSFGSFEIETITKVGYRLVTGGNGSSGGTTMAAESGPQAGIGRRGMIAGGSAAVLAATGLLAWKRPWRHHPPADAVELVRLGNVSVREGIPSQSRQAVTYFERATRIDPLYAEAWGAEALALSHLLEGYGEAETRALHGRLQSAAQRALALDADNPDALLALILAKPLFGHWAAMEGEMRRLMQRHPRHWLLLGRLGSLLFDVGRIEEGIALNQRLQGIDRNLPVAEAFLANGLLTADRLQEAEAALDEGRERWPANPSLWTAKYKYLLFTGRPQAAAAFVMDPDALPSGMTRDDVAPYFRLARAVDGRQAADIEVSVADFQAKAAKDVQSTPLSAAVFALLGRPDLTFAAWERYFFNQGDFGPSAPIQPLTRRYARELFSRPMAPLRSDPRFASLLSRIGLEDYWRQTGTQPDYRRTA